LNCPYCGQNLLDPIPPSCPNLGKILPKPNDPPYVDQLQADYQTRKGLGDLRNAFMLYLVGSAITLIPVIGAIGGIISLVALILLIIGWRALGRSSLKERENYRSTGSWLVYGIIIAIVIGIVGTVVVVGLVVSYFIAHPLPATSPPAVPSLAKFPELAQFLFAFILEIGLIILVWYLAWIKMLNSIKKLSSELSQPRLRTAANLIILQILTSIVIGVALVLVFLFGNYSSLFSNIISHPNLSSLGVFGYFGLGGFLPLVALISIGEEIVVIVSYYLAYSALGSAIGNLAPVAPPQMNATQFCPHCGHAVDSPNIFCPSCGSKLKS